MSARSRSGGRQAGLDRLGLRTVVDFRTPGEVLLDGPDRFR
jgi:hypothetical protein